MSNRRRNLNEQARYSYQLEHFQQRIRERYGDLYFDEGDFLILNKHIKNLTTGQVQELARNKDGTVIYRVRHRGHDIICNYNPDVTLPTRNGDLLNGVITTVLDPKKADKIKPK